MVSAGTREKRLQLSFLSGLRFRYADLVTQAPAASEVAEQMRYRSSTRDTSSASRRGGAPAEFEGLALLQIDYGVSRACRSKCSRSLIVTLETIGRPRAFRASASGDFVAARAFEERVSAVQKKA